MRTDAQAAESPLRMAVPLRVALFSIVPAGAFMTNPDTPAPRRKNSLWPSRLWIAAGIIVFIGFVLRPLGSFFGRELRYTGIIVIAIGAVVAVIAWLDERWNRGNTDS